MVKTSNATAQKALTYCIYIMMAGNFDGCEMETSTLEKKFILNLRELRDKDQEKLEDSAARLADKFFLRTLPKDMWKESPKAYFKLDDKTGISDVTFKGSDWILRIVGTVKGERKKPKFYYSLKKRKEVRA